MSRVLNAMLSLANHAKGLITIFVLTIFGGAAVYSAIEPYTYLQALEWATYMTTSTGLGSYGATTAAGQILGVFLMLWGPVFLVALVTGVVVNALRVDPNVFTDDEQKEIIAILRELRERGTPVYNVSVVNPKVDSKV